MSDSRNASISTNRPAKQCRASGLSFESSKPCLKHYGQSRIFNRRCLAKQYPMSALLIERIRIPNASNSESMIVNR